MDKVKWRTGKQKTLIELSTGLITSRRLPQQIKCMLCLEVIGFPFCVREAFPTSVCLCMC